MGSDKASRRDVIRLFGGAGLVSIVGCGGGGFDAAPGDGEAACGEIPRETPGPFPGDGTNGANALALAGIVRSDIRASIGGASGVAEGVLLTLELTLVEAGAACAPLSGLAVYLWHCDREGRYSMYSDGVTGENYLRGVQESDADGLLSFTTIFPGCYPGRWPHMHFAVYPSVADALESANIVMTSQLALPAEACSQAYAAAGYGASRAALDQVSLQGDGVFRDGSSRQLARVTGDIDAGYVAALQVATAQLNARGVAR